MKLEDFTSLVLFNEYSLPELALLWGYKTHDAIRRAVVTPSDSNIIILFLQDGINHLSGSQLTMCGEAKHVNDKRIASNLHNSKDNIFLFFRSASREKYTYFGKIILKKADVQEKKASTFIFDVSSLEETGRKNYYVIKTSDPEFVNAFKKRQTPLTLKGLNSYETADTTIKAGDPIILVLGGNMVSWTLGLVAFARASSGPIREQEQSKNYNITVDNIVFISPTMTKQDFIPYKDSYDSFVGPNTKGSRNQALQMISEQQVIAILRGVLDKHPDLESSLSELFSKTIMQKVKLPMQVYSVSVQEYGKQADTYCMPKTDDTSGENVILYGMPGSGKSYTVKTEYCNDDDLIERVTFYPDYTYADFIGQIILQTDPDSHQISYVFVDGPFTSILKKAWEHPERHYYLIIEEINRGNAPAIFGDIFQLLDRDQNGESVYGINNQNILKNGKVKIPGNMSIIATMNTADQSIFTLDTAFKRRWKMRFIPNNIDQCLFGNKTILDTNITWEGFVKTINEAILSESAEMAISEDKRLGAYFIKEEDLQMDGNNYNPSFAEKVLMYLWTDVFKYNKERIFIEQYNSLDKLLEGFEKNRFGVFKIKFAEDGEKNGE